MRKLIAPLLLLIVTIIVFHAWFTPGLLSTYDFLYYSQIMLKGAHLGLYAWDWHISFDGFAKFFAPYSWVFLAINIPQVILGKYLGLDWALIERIAYLYPLVTLLVMSPIYFFKTLFPKSKLYLFAVLMFSFNTYAILLAGGEVFLALAYALIPLIFALYSKSIPQNSLKRALLIGLSIAIQIMFDPRVTYVTMVAVLLYLIYSYGIQPGKWKDIPRQCIYLFIIPFAEVGLLHAYWIIPTLLYGRNPVTSLGAAYSTLNAVSFLSFAKFENTISLLHPNWPENIFGKVYFMRPEFLLLPILAYASLLFLNKQKKTAQLAKNQQTETSHEVTHGPIAQSQIILFFALLGLVGAFLAKGNNDPFGAIYMWMFNHVPGFIMFRDPAKWYPLVALSYAVLIPFTIEQIYTYTKAIHKFIPNIFLICMFCALLFTIRPALSGQLGGMLKTTAFPQEYNEIEQFLSEQPSYFRTLWYPTKQRFGYYSENHPEISAQVLLNTYDEKMLIKKLATKTTETLLQESSIKYVIIPYDSEKEIFLTDRKYDNKKYLQTINALDKISWLQKRKAFGKNIVYEVPHTKNHFWSPTTNLTISSIYQTPTQYSVAVKNAQKGEQLIFSESFDKQWVAKVGNANIPSSNYHQFNSFRLPQDGNYNLDISYTPQGHVIIGEWVSGISFIAVICLLILLNSVYS